MSGTGGRGRPGCARAGSTPAIPAGPSTSGCVGSGCRAGRPPARRGCTTGRPGDWDRGVQKINSSRVYSDGRRVDYPGNKVTVEPVLPSVDKVLHPRFLSLLERELIADLRRAGWSMRAIAIRLGRPASTVSRELGRCREPDEQAGAPYRPHAAHRAAALARARPKTAKLAEDGPLRRYVQAKLDQRWSPEQISHALREDHPGDGQMQVAPRRSTRPFICRPEAGCAARSQPRCAPAELAANPAVTRPPARPASPMRWS